MNLTTEKREIRERIHKKYLKSQIAQIHVNSGQGQEDQSSNVKGSRSKVKMPTTFDLNRPTVVRIRTFFQLFRLYSDIHTNEAVRNNVSKNSGFRIVS